MDIITIEEAMILEDYFLEESSNNSNRKNIATQAQSKLKSAMKNVSFKKHIEWVKSSEFDKDFLDGNYDSQTLFYLDMWKIFGNARAAMDDGRIDVLSKELKNILDKTKISGGTLEITGDWDEYLIQIVIK